MPRGKADFEMFRIRTTELVQISDLSRLFATLTAVSIQCGYTRLIRKTITYRKGDHWQNELDIPSTTAYQSNLSYRIGRNCSAAERLTLFCRYLGHRRMF